MSENKQIESEPVYQICMADSVSISGAWIDVDKQTYHDAGLYKEYKLRSLYTAPQPDRTAEQRVAEACARVCREIAIRHLDEFDEPGMRSEVADKCNVAITQGEWRKFVKEGE